MALSFKRRASRGLRSELEPRKIQGPANYALARGYAEDRMGFEREKLEPRIRKPAPLKIKGCGTLPPTPLLAHSSLPPSLPAFPLSAEPDYL